MSSDKTVRVTVALLAFAWLAVITIVDVSTGPTVRLGPLYAVAPLLACAALPAEVTALYALAAAALAVASGHWNHATGTAQEAVLLLEAVILGSAAVVAAGVRTRREATHARVSALAETAQRAILPTLPARTTLVATAARYEAAGQDALVGGDLYDSYHCEAFSRYIVGDVRGKGIAAVEQAARVIRAFRQSAATPASLPGVASEMSAYLRPFLAEEEFVTALLVELRSPRQLTVVDCGHPPPLLLTGVGAAFVDIPAGLPLGWGEEYQAAAVAWDRGDRLLMYTDGLVEARNASGEFLPLLDLAELLTGAPVESALDTLLDAVRAHVPKRRRLTDDLAVVLLENISDPDHATIDTTRRRATTGTAPAAVGGGDVIQLFTPGEPHHGDARDTA